MHDGFPCRIKVVYDLLITIYMLLLRCIDQPLYFSFFGLCSRRTFFYNSSFRLFLAEHLYFRAQRPVGALLYALLSSCLTFVHFLLIFQCLHMGYFVMLIDLHSCSPVVRI